MADKRTASKRYSEEFRLQAAKMESTIQALKAAGVSAKVMVGGAPVTQSFADKIGAQGYAPDAATAVDLAKRLIA